MSVRSCSVIRSIKAIKDRLVSLKEFLKPKLYHEAPSFILDIAL